MLKKYFFSFLLLMAAFALPAAAQTDAPTIVIIIRHAEKQAAGNPQNNDPSLSEAGAKRAQALIQAVEDAGISAIYTTQFKRARETAQPLAEKLNIPVTPFEVTAANFNNYSSALVEQVLAKHAGKTVLIIGHGNTVPQTVKALGGKMPPAIDETTEFDRLYVVIVPKTGEAKVVAGRY